MDINSNHLLTFRDSLRCESPLDPLKRKRDDEISGSDDDTMSKRAKVQTITNTLNIDFDSHSTPLDATHIRSETQSNLMVDGDVGSSKNIQKPLFFVSTSDIESANYLTTSTFDVPLIPFFQDFKGDGKNTLSKTKNNRIMVTFAGDDREITTHCSKSTQSLGKSLSLSPPFNENILLDRESGNMDMDVELRPLSQNFSNSFSSNQPSSSSSISQIPILPNDSVSISQSAQTHINDNKNINTNHNNFNIIPKSQTSKYLHFHQNCTSGIEDNSVTNSSQLPSLVSSQTMSSTHEMPNEINVEQVINTDVEFTCKSSNIVVISDVLPSPPLDYSPPSLINNKTVPLLQANSSLHNSKENSKRISSFHFGRYLSPSVTSIGMTLENATASVQEGLHPCDEGDFDKLTNDLLLYDDENTSLSSSDNENIIIRASSEYHTYTRNSDHHNHQQKHQNLFNANWATVDLSEHSSSSSSFENILLESNIASDFIGVTSHQPNEELELLFNQPEKQENSIKHNEEIKNSNRSNNSKNKNIQKIMSAKSDDGVVHLERGRDTDTHSTDLIDNRHFSGNNNLTTSLSHDDDHHLISLNTNNVLDGDVTAASSLSHLTFNTVRSPPNVVSINHQKFPHSLSSQSGTKVKFTSHPVPLQSILKRPHLIKHAQEHLNFNYTEDSTIRKVYDQNTGKRIGNDSFSPHNHFHSNANFSFPILREEQNENKDITDINLNSPLSSPTRHTRTASLVEQLISNTVGSTPSCLSFMRLLSNNHPAVSDVSWISFLDADVEKPFSEFMPEMEMKNQQNNLDSSLVTVRAPRWASIVSGTTTSDNNIENLKAGNKRYNQLNTDNDGDGGSGGDTPAPRIRKRSKKHEDNQKNAFLIYSPSTDNPQDSANIYFKEIPVLPTSSPSKFAFNNQKSSESARGAATSSSMIASSPFADNSTLSSSMTAITPLNGSTHVLSYERRHRDDAGTHHLSNIPLPFGTTSSFVPSKRWPGPQTSLHNEIESRQLIEDLGSSATTLPLTATKIKRIEENKGEQEIVMDSVEQVEEKIQLEGMKTSFSSFEQNENRNLRNVKDDNDITPLPVARQHIKNVVNINGGILPFTSDNETNSPSLSTDSSDDSEKTIAEEGDFTSLANNKRGMSVRFAPVTHEVPLDSSLPAITCNLKSVQESQHALQMECSMSEEAYRVVVSLSSLNKDDAWRVVSHADDVNGVWGKRTLEGGVAFGAANRSLGGLLPLGEGNVLNPVSFFSLS